MNEIGYWKGTEDRVDICSARCLRIDYLISLRSWLELSPEDGNDCAPKRCLHSGSGAVLQPSSDKPTEGLSQISDSERSEGADVIIHFRPDPPGGLGEQIFVAAILVRTILHKARRYLLRGTLLHKHNLTSNL